MGKEALELLPPIVPIDCFAVEADLQYCVPGRLKTEHMLPNLSVLLGEEHFADVWMGWNEEGISVQVFVHQSFEECAFPDFAGRDAVELFFDTRDLKTAGFATRFCHQFLFLPEEVVGVQCQELTRFRTEDTHPLCDPADLQVKTLFQKNSYEMQIFLPAHVLHGFEPAAFDRLGFTYRVHRCQGEPQHFAVSAEHFKIEQHPKFWASLKVQK